MYYGVILKVVNHKRDSNLHLGIIGWERIKSLIVSGMENNYT